MVVTITFQPSDFESEIIIRETCASFTTGRQC